MEPWVLFALSLWLFLAAGAFMLWRNEYVYRYRIAILDDESRPHSERLKRLKALPIYPVMWLTVWKFDWSEYLGGE